MGCLHIVLIIFIIISFYFRQLYSYQPRFFLDYLCWKASHTLWISHLSFKHSQRMCSKFQTVFTLFKLLTTEIGKKWVFYKALSLSTIFYRLFTRSPPPIHDFSITPSLFSFLEKNIPSSWRKKDNNKILYLFPGYNICMKNQSHQ